MIPVHRLTHNETPVYINPDHIQLIEAAPDTVLTLANGSRFVVAESPDAVTDLIRRWRSSILRTV